ncbi:MAG: hypothetical protein GY720_13675, partial [bacterium]|nr:hypothetical protein [bacterium]
AQRTIIVDQAGGPGTQSRDLPAAIASAARGDLILVRAGSYTGGVVLDKSIRILGEPNSVIRNSAALTVRGLRASDHVSVQGLRFDSGAGRVTIEGCAGRVVLSDLSPLLSNGGARLTLDVRNSKLVVIATSRFSGDASHAAAVKVSRSMVILQRVQTKGAAGGSRAGAGLTVIDSDVTSQSCILRGGDASGGQAGYAIEAWRSTLTLAGSIVGRSRLEVGSGPAPSAGILAVSTKVTAESDSRKLSFPGVTGGGAVVRKSMASLMVDPPRVGGQFRATIEGDIYSQAMLCIGNLKAPTAWGSERLFLDPASLSVIATAQISMFGWWSYQTTIPNDSVLRGMTFAFQAIAMPSSGAKFSAPSVVTVN